MLLGDQREAAGAGAGGEFPGEPAGGYRQHGACHAQVGAGIENGEPEGRHGHATRSEHQRNPPKRGSQLTAIHYSALEDKTASGDAGG